MAMKLKKLLYEVKFDSNKREKIYLQYMHNLRKAAYRGHPVAQYELGQQYEDINSMGFNPKYNPQKCFYWYKKACQGNCGSACNNLASLYEGEKKYAKALKCYEKAAELGDIFARKNYTMLLKEIKKNKLLE